MPTSRWTIDGEELLRSDIDVRYVCVCMHVDIHMHTYTTPCVCVCLCMNVYTNSLSYFWFHNVLLHVTIFFLFIIFTPKISKSNHHHSRLIKCPALSRVHRHLISIFARGVEPLGPESSSSSNTEMGAGDRTEQEDLLPES